MSQQSEVEIRGGQARIALDFLEPWIGARTAKLLTDAFKQVDAGAMTPDMAYATVLQLREVERLSHDLQRAISRGYRAERDRLAVERDHNI